MSLEEKARKLAEQKKRTEAIDWDAEGRWWQQQLEELYRKISTWLRPLETEGVLTLRRAPMQLSEQHIGTYDADALVLEFSGEGVVLEPQGTLVVGARGRVDVFRRGRRGSQPVMLILSGSKEEATWKIWYSRDPQQRQELNEANFKTLVESFL